MSYEFLDLYVFPVKPSFSGFDVGRDKAKFIIIGVPFDSTTSQRPGTRFGPKAIREASVGLEGYSLRTNKFPEDLMIHDAGDLSVLHGDLRETQRRLENVINDIKSENKIPVVIGGEHSITLAPVRILKPEILIVFDAHLDLRNEWPPGVKNSHATVMRRISEYIGLNNIIFIGSRAYSKEEYELIKNRKVLILNPKYLETNFEESIYTIKERIHEANNIYISIDLDALDPSQAPGVGDPEPEGLSLTTLLDTLNEIIKFTKNINGIDLVELSPPYDPGFTAHVAAKILFEILSYI
ncbi:MAG: agmatinase [Thermoprotei archaeon]|jgi:agmatinase